MNELTFEAACDIVAKKHFGEMFKWNELQDHIKISMMTKAHDLCISQYREEVERLKIGHVDDYSKPHVFFTFAFIKEKKEAESQDELWDTALTDAIVELEASIKPYDLVKSYLKSKFKIERL